MHSHTAERCAGPFMIVRFCMISEVKYVQLSWILWPTATGNESPTSAWEALDGFTARTSRTKFGGHSHWKPWSGPDSK